MILRRHRENLIDLRMRLQFLRQSIEGFEETRPKKGATPSNIITTTWSLGNFSRIALSTITAGSCAREIDAGRHC